MVTSIKGNDTSTFGGNIDVPQIVTDAPAFSAYQSSVQTLSSGTFTKIQFQSEEFDTNSNFDSTTNYRFTPTVAGYYQFNTAITVGASLTPMQGAFYKNGSIYKVIANTGASVGAILGSSLIYCNGSTDYVEVYGFVTTGQALSTNGQTYVYFQGSLVRAV